VPDFIVRVLLNFFFFKERNSNLDITLVLILYSREKVSRYLFHSQLMQCVRIYTNTMTAFCLLFFYWQNTLQQPTKNSNVKTRIITDTWNIMEHMHYALTRTIKIRSQKTKNFLHLLNAFSPKFVQVYWREQ